MPQTSGSTPNDCCSPANVGDHLVPNRKSPIGTVRKKWMVSSSSDPTIASVVTTDRPAAANSAMRTPPSNRERALGARVRSTRPPVAPAAAARRGSAI